MSKSAQRASAVDRPESFQLKGGLFPMTLLELKTTDLAAIQAELTDKVSQSPAFFTQSPLVFGVELLSETEQRSLDLAGLLQICKELNLLPTATRGGIPELAGATQRLGLAVLPKGRKSAESAPPEDIPAAAPAPAPPLPPASLPPP